MKLSIESSLTKRGLLWVSMSAIFLLCFILSSATAHAGESFKDGQLYSADGRLMTIEEFAVQAQEYDYILIGETHDAPHHHLMQAKLLEAVAGSGRRPVVGFEMLYSRNQNELTTFNERKIKVKELEKTSGWEKSWSYPFAIYAPIFEVAEQFNLPVYGLNISKATLDLVKAKGFNETRDTVSQDQRPDLPKEVIWPMPEQVEHLNKTRERLARGTELSVSQNKSPEESHKSDQAQPGQEPPRAVDPKRFLLVQSLWDTSMAESAVKAHEESGLPVVIIAGSGHVESGYGIAHRIRTLTPDKKIMLVAPLSSPFEKDDERKSAADVFFASRPSILSLGLVFKAEAGRIVVDELTGGSRAEKAGLLIGDQIISLEEKPLKSPGDLHSAIAIADLADKRNKLNEKRPKIMVVERNGAQFDLTLN